MNRLEELEKSNVILRKKLEEMITEQKLVKSKKSPTLKAEKDTANRIAKLEEAVTRFQEKVKDVERTSFTGYEGGNQWC